MTKLGKKGFMLAETLVVSSVLLITFTFLYVQFFDVLNKYTIYSDYDNIDKLYNVYNLKEFVKEDNLDSIINQLQNNIGNNTPYVDLTNCSKFSETEYCSTLFNQLNVKRLIFTNYNLNLFSNWNGITHNFNKKLQTYINTLQANYGELYNKFYRIIVEYKDSSFSTGRLSAGNVTDIDTDWSEWQSLGSTSNVDYINQNDVHYMYPTDVRSVGYMDFDGVNDTIQVPHSSSLSVNNTDEITEMAWVNPRAYVANGTIATKGLSYYFQIHSNGKVATYTYWDNGGVRTESSYFYSNNTVPLNEWTHVAFTEDSTGRRKIYINGILDNSGQFEASIFASSNALQIGAENGIRYFNGKIRDVAIFNRDLSQEEIQEAMNDGLSGTESGLLAYYPLNDGIGNIATDYFGNNNGAVIDGTWGYTYSSNPDVLKNLTNPIVEQVDIDGTLTNVVTRNNSLYEVQTKVDSYRYNDYALEFHRDNIEDYVSLGNIAGIESAQTLLVKAKILEYDVSANRIISKAQSSGFILDANDNKLRYGPHIDGSYRNVFSNNNYIVGKEYTIAGTYDGQTVKLFVDGVQQSATFNISGSITLNNNIPILIGADPDGSGLPTAVYDGSVVVSQLYIFNRALSAAEISTYYNTNIISNKNGLVAQYDFNEGSGNILNDSVGNNDGTIYTPNWKLSGMSNNIDNDFLTNIYQAANTKFSYRYRLISDSNELAGTTYNFSYTGNYQTFVAPVTGTYKIELWGASGGNARITNTTTIVERSGGRGSYTSGQITLNQGETLTIHVGEKGANQKSLEPLTVSTGGYNGGGIGGIEIDGEHSPEAGAGGGGATDIRLVSGAWNNNDSLRSRIMVASGGGGATSHLTSHFESYGGNAGGLTSYTNSTFTTIATQTSGYALGIGKDGYNGKETGNYGPYGGAGSGYYGGTWTVENTTTSTAQGGAGGSSFISGHPGCNAINSSGIHTGQPNHYSGYVFSNTMMIDGNSLMPSPVGNLSHGHNGHGHARITLINAD